MPVELGDEELRKKCRTPAEVAAGHDPIPDQTLGRLEPPRRV